MRHSDRVTQRGAVLGLLLVLALPSMAGGQVDRICELPQDPGPCDGVCRRWFFNGASNLCEQFGYGCCGGNANNFQTLLECQAVCACELPQDPGPCDGACPRWFFNSKSGQCEEFIWGCCEGNANNFESLADCQTACGKAPCPADVNGSGTVDVPDLVAVLLAWGKTGGPADVNGDGLVDVQDLVQILLAWGDCGS